MSRMHFNDWAKKLVRRGQRNPKARSLTRTSTFERLGDRITPAVNAFFANGQLTILGDAADNAIVVSRDAAGAIQVNGGAVHVLGGTPSVANTARVKIFGLAGNDSLSLDETNGALPQAILFGGSGNDSLTGGSAADFLFGQAGSDSLLGKGGVDFLFGGAGNDVLTGGAGADQAFGEAGADRMIWNPGDGSDLNEGGAGSDTVEINGGNGAEIFVITANGARVRFDRTISAPFSIDIGTSESLILNANGGDDRLTANGNLAGLIALTLDGGAGNDGIFGGNGADVLLGGDGDDFIDGNQGADNVSLGAGDDSFQWDPGDGSDTVEGQAGFDMMQFNGNDLDEAFDFSAVSGRTRLARNVGNIVVDTNDLEQVNIAAFRGVDQITVNDLSSADVTDVFIDLTFSGGALGDGQNDTVTIFGTNGNDAVDVTGAGFNYAVAGLRAFVAVTGSEATDSLVINALAGNDAVSAPNLAAGIVKLTVDGGAGNDTLIGSPRDDVLIGGDGNDFIDGNGGDDQAFLGAGDDVFRWDPGDGSDVMEGGAGRDAMVFNGSNDSEIVRIAANGNRVGFLRSVGNVDSVRMDLNDVEQIDFNALGGGDTIFVNDQTATDLTTLNLNLKASTGLGDGQADAIVISGTSGDDAIQIASFDNGSRVAVATTSFPFVNITGAEAANDRLVVNTLDGDDVVDAGSLAANAIGLTLNGGAGNDELLAGGGNDVVSGGAGDDMIFLEAGNDTFIWNLGDGNDTVEGMDGRDTLIFNGAATSETIDLSANGGRLRLTDDVGGVVMDVNDLEQVNVNAGDGADAITVNDLSGTDVTDVKLTLDLTPISGVGGFPADTVIVKGTGDADFVQILGTGGSFSVVGLSALVTVDGVQEGNDLLVVDALAGNDVVNASALPANLINLAVLGGAGNDTLRGSQGGDAISGGAGDDTVFLEAGDDGFIWNPGDGNDMVEGMAGRDTMIFNGSNLSENITISANGERVRFTRDVDNVTMDLNDVERINVNALGGADAIVVNDLSGTDVTEVNLDLNAIGGGDGRADNVIVNGANGSERIVVTNSVSGGEKIEGLAAVVNITAPDADLDQLTINALGGNDTVDASGLNAGLHNLNISGGDGDDVLNGGAGNDSLTGGAGNDILSGGAGDDVLIGGLGQDILNGGPGNNIVIQD